MAVIELNDGTKAYVYSDSDFRDLVERYMGYDAARWVDRWVDKSKNNVLDIVEEKFDYAVRYMIEDYWYGTDEFNNQMELGEWLRKRRESMHLSQKQLSEIISKRSGTKSTSLSNIISKIERGERNVPVKYREAYASVLNIKVGEFDDACDRLWRPHDE